MLNLVALLEQQKSRVQINKDIKELEKVVSKLKLIGTLTKGQTKTMINQTIQQLEAQLRQVKLQTKIDNRQLNREINNALRNVSARDIRLNINGNGERLNAQLRRILSQAREFADRNPIRVNIDLKKEKLLNQLTTFINKNTKINESSYWLGEAERLRTVISSVSNREELRNATDQLQVFTTGVRATGYATVSTTDKIKGMLGNVLKVCNYFGLAFTAVNKFRQSLASLKEMDTLLTEISKTSEMTAKQLEQLGNRSYSIASKYGVLANNFMESFREMSRAGFGENKAQSLAELATLAQSAGDLTSELANEYLIASNAAYGYSGNVEQLNELLDAQNQVTNRNAVSMSELAEATKVAANQLANAAISEQEMTALLGTGIATTKESGQVVGRAVKAIVMNLQQVQNTEEGFETTAEDLGKVESCLDSLGIKMKETADGITRLRSPLAILSELAEVYNSLPEDSVERANIISDIGGKYRGNVLSSILSNWDTYIKMMGDYEDAAGSALREAEKSADSWEGRLAQLQNSWDSFVNTLTNKDAVKGSISFLDTTIQAFEKLTDTVGALPVMLTTINASMAALNKNYGITRLYNKDTHRIDLQGNFMGIDISAYKTQIKHFRDAEVAMASWNNSLIDGTANVNDFNNATVQNNEHLKAYLQTTSADAPASLNGYKAYLNAAGVSTDALRLKTVMLNAAISIGVGIALQLAMKGIVFLAQKMNDFAHASEKCKERMDELMSSYQSALDKANSNAKTIENLASRYEELSKGVNNLGQNVSLATDEYNEYNDIVNQIAEMFPTMVQGYTDEGNAILSLKGNVEQLRDAYKEAQQEAYNMLIVSGEDSDGNDIIKNYQNVMSNSNSFIKLDSSAKEYLEIIKALHEAMLASEEEYDRLYNAMLGGGNKLVNDYNMSRAQLNKVKKTLKEIGFQADLTDEDKRNINANVKAYIQTYQAEVDMALKNVQTLANAYLMTNEDYVKLDEQSQNAASIIVNSIDENIASGFDDKINVGKYVNEIVGLIKDNPEVQDALVGLFTLDVSEIPINEAKKIIDQYIHYIADALEEDEYELKIRLGFEDVDTLASNYETIMNRAAEKYSGKPVIPIFANGKIVHEFFDPDYLNEIEALENFAKENSINTQDEIAFWNQCIEESDTREEAMEKYLASTFVKGEPITPLSITETVEQIDTRLKSAFSSLQSAYQEIFTLDEDTKEELFTPLDEADITDKFKPILDALQDLDEIDGVTVDYSSYEDFVSVLSDTSSTAEEVHEQFNRLATDIIYTSDCTNMSAETFNLLAESLSEMGITNAYEVLGKIRDAQEELVELGYDATAITKDEAKSIIELGLASIETEEYLRQYLLQKELSQNPLSTADDIAQLENLCSALGVTGEMYQTVIALKGLFDAKGNSSSHGIHDDNLDSAIAYYQQQLQDLANGSQYDFFGFNFARTNQKSSSKSSSSSKDTTETFDWIEQAIENVEKEIKELDEIVDSSYSTFSEKNEALAQEISKVSDEIALQQQAYDEYMRKAESIALPDQYKQLVQSGAINIEDISDENIKNLISEYQKWYDKAQDVSDTIKELKTDMKDLYVSAYELQKDNLKDRLDSDSITQKQYLDGLKEAYEKFYADLEDFAEQYHEAVLEYLEEEKNYLNSVASAATSLLDTEIDKIQEDAKLQEEAIQRQIGLLEAKKKPLQDELDALEDKARKEELIYNLQKAQQALANAENQRTKLLYKDGQMVYTADPESIRDAKKGVDDAKLEIQKQAIQDQIDALDDEIDRYNDLIDQINNAADIQINALEKIKNKWQEVIDQQEYAKNVLAFTGEFGTDAITKLLTGNDDDLLEQWKNNYITTLANLDIESQGYIGDMTDQIASLYGVDLSPLQEQFQGVKDSVNDMTDSLGRTASAIGNGISVPDYNQDSEGNIAPANLTDSINGVGIAANESLPNVTSNMDNIAEAAINAASEVSSVTDAINNIPESKDVTISVHTVGGGVSSEVSFARLETGKAYADGTDGLTHDEKDALRSEYGQQELTVYPDGTTELTTQPVMSDLPKGTVVYNEEQTKKILDNKPVSTGNAFTNGTTDDGYITTPDGTKLRPLQPGDKMYDMLQKWNAYMNRMDNNLEEITRNVVDSQMKPMSDFTKQITNSNIVNNNNNQPNVSINVTCPGVTSQEVVRQIGTELNNVFNGLSLKAYQRANITR